MKRFLTPLFALIAFLFLWYCLQNHQEYLFYYREQHQLFIFDSGILLERLAQLGGGAILLAQALVQWFYLPQMGALITAATGVAAAYAIWRAVRGKNNRLTLLPLCLLPIAYICADLYDINTHYDLLTAFLLMSLALWLWSAAGARLTAEWRALLGSALTVLLFLLAGPAASAFAVSTLLLDVSFRRKQGWMQILSPLTALALGLWAVGSGQMEYFRQAFLFTYYEPMLVPSLYYSIPFMLVPLLIVASALISLLPEMKPLRSSLLTALLLIAACILSWHQSQHGDRKMYTFTQLQHYALTGQWEKILGFEDATSGHNALYMNFVNLALLKQGKLATDLLNYPQRNLIALLITDEMSGRIPDMSALMAHIYYEMGNIGAALCKAFDANECAVFGNPAMLKLMIKCNIIYGHYAVAEKYLYMMQHTVAYADWAREQQKYLYNDRKVAADAEYGKKRRDLPATDGFSLRQGPLPDLLRILRTNPHDRNARDYAIALLIVGRDIQSISDFIKEFLHTPVLSPMPQYLQEAVVTANESKPDTWKALGVSADTEERYRDYKQTFILARDSGRNPMAALQAKYGNTFWFYYMFCNPQQ